MAQQPAKAQNNNTNILKRRVSKQTATLVLALALATAMLAVSGSFWWTRIFMDPDKVFQSMLANNLSSMSMSKSVGQSSQQSKIDQNVFVSFWPPEVMSESRTVLSERAGSKGITTVTTDTIGTKQGDYVRYVSAEGADDLSIAGNLDEVIGVWASQKPDTAQGETGSFLNEALFSIVPYGNLSQPQRAELINFMNEKNLYDYDESKVERTFENGRNVYSYNVALDPVTYVEILQKYVEITGIGDAAQLNPEQYQSASAISLNIKVDILSRQLVSVEYVSNGRTETYPSRNLYRDIKVPEQTIPFEELQKRLTGSAPNGLINCILSS